MIAKILENVANKQKAVKTEPPETGEFEFKRPHFNPEIVEVTGNAPYLPGGSTGGFFLCSPVDDNTVKANSSHGWFTCREVFSGSFTKDSLSFFFGVEDLARAMSIVYFMIDFERKSGISDNIQIRLTKHPKVVLIYVSKWWRENLARRQLLTILLRNGTQYREDFDKSLFSGDYAGPTKKAISKFMEGFTKTGATGDKKIQDHGGWYGTFNGGHNLTVLEK